jgi:hypothetical protein
VRQNKEIELESLVKPHNLLIIQADNKRKLELFDKHMHEELDRQDFRTIIEMDHKVLEQQDTMKKAGVPGFFVSQCPIETKIQMYIFEFIQRLSKMKL